MSSSGAPTRTTFAGHALLISNDGIVEKQILHAMQNFAFTVDTCSKIESAAQLIFTRKFQAIILDTATDEEATKLFDFIKYSPSNRTAVTFAVVGTQIRSESQVAPSFVLYKPLTDSLLASTLKAAMGTIIRDYRRYFRCPLKVPGTIRITDRPPIQCELMNISEGGVAVSNCNSLDLGKPVTLLFELPGTAHEFEIEAEVCWSDARSRAGLHFCYLSAQQKAHLQAWLSSRIEESFPEPIVQLFRNQQ